MIHETAIVEHGAVIGANAEIGAFSIIGRNVKIGDGVKIGSHCQIGVESGHSENEPLVIGNDSLIRSHSIFYLGSVFGEGLTTGHSVTVREKTIAGKNFQIGTLSDIQGHCEIGDYVRFHSNVHVGNHSKIGNYVWIFPYVVLTNDPHPPSTVQQGVTINDYAAIATMSVILPGAVIGEGVLVGAHSSVKDARDAHYLYVGSPAKKICKTADIKLQDGSGDPAYPWTRHYHRGYPENVVKEWLSK